MTVPKNYKSVINDFALDEYNNDLNQQSILNDHMNDVKDHTANVLSNNKDLVDIMNQLSTSGGTGENIDSDDREQLYNHLKFALKSNNKTIIDNVKYLQNSLNDENNRILDYENNEKYIKYLIDILENEQTIIDDEYDRLKDDLEFKKRNLQINVYYEKKYKKQTELIKNIIIIASVLLVVTFIFKLGVISERVFISIAGITFAIIAIYFGYSIIDIYLRDNMVFDEYDHWHFGKSSEDDGIVATESTLHLYGDVDSKCITSE